ncbi:hypothetical protein BDZ91DRAFT_723558 [Kalaharituber pfeilii]|nr:hypothetical protein BDZ91DRAFT_723558 [Kalaharituber pfeilii]
MYEMTRPGLRNKNPIFRAECCYTQRSSISFLVHHIQHYVLFCEQLLPKAMVVEGDVYTFTWEMKWWIRD